MARPIDVLRTIRGLRTRGRTSAFAVLLALLSVTTAVTPAAGQSINERVTMDFDGIELRQAIQFILRQRAINLVTGEELSARVTVKLIDVEWRQALRAILMVHGYTFLEERGILRVVPTAAPTGGDRKSVPFVLQLRHAEAGSTKKILEAALSEQGRIVVLDGGSGPSRTLTVFDEAPVIEIIKQMIQEIDVAPRPPAGKLTHNSDGTLDFDLEDYPLSQLADLLRNELDLNVFVDGSLSGLTTVHLKHVRWPDALGLILKEQGYSFREQDGVVIIGASESFQIARLTRQFRLRYVDGFDLKPYLEALLAEGDSIACFAPSPRVAFEFGTKVSDPRSQSETRQVPRSRLISVTAHSETITAIERRIEELDIKPRQVEIKVKVVQIDRQHDDFRGIDWSAMLSARGATRPTNLPFGPHSGEYTPGNFPDPSGSFTFGQLRADELTAVLRLLNEREDTDIVSEPTITAIDNVEASILIGQKFPVTSETVDPQTAVRTVALDYYEDIGIQLLVVPTISEGNRIHLVIHPAVSSVAELVENRYPVINTREADTQILLRSGETAIIGGLIETRTTKTRRGVPYLRNIPLLGRLFEFNLTEDLKTELVIFVTPKIILDDEDTVGVIRSDSSRTQALAALRSELDEVLGR